MGEKVEALVALAGGIHVSGYTRVVDGQVQHVDAHIRAPRDMTDEEIRSDIGLISELLETETSLISRNQLENRQQQLRSEMIRRITGVRSSNGLSALYERLGISPEA